MFALSYRRLVSRAQLPNPRQIAARSAAGVVALLACLLLAIPSGASAVGDDKAPAPLAADDGFTRETLSEFDAPEPAPFAPAAAASVETAPDGRDSQAAAHHHRRSLRHHPAGHDPSQTVVIRAVPRRSPVASFVYWWNGFVIKTFHTKVGTVMLGTVGAKT